MLFVRGTYSNRTFAPPVQPYLHITNRRLGSLDLTPSTIVTPSHYLRNDKKQHEHLHDETRHEKEQLTGEDSSPAMNLQTGDHVSPLNEIVGTQLRSYSIKTHILVSLYHHIRHRIHPCSKTERERI
jgi:hypothetical protein